jgi:hypothetical protein
MCFRLQARGGGAPTLQKNQKLAFPQAMPEQKKINHSLFVKFQTLNKMTNFHEILFEQLATRITLLYSVTTRWTLEIW